MSLKEKMKMSSTDLNVYIINYSFFILSSSEKSEFSNHFNTILNEHFISTFK